jgi:TIR domain/Sulfatase-modifying factor enzyme 1
MSKVFISYRREDSAGYAHAIHSQLAQHFSKDRVFMDVDTVEPGVDFERVIEKAVGECDVLVALIGRRWMGSEQGGTSRLDNTKDYVRLEISTALARDIRVIPVLVDGMTMPNEEILPAPLRSLIRRQAMEISNTRFNFDVERLIAAVRRTLSESEEIQHENVTGGAQHLTRRKQPFASPRLIYGMVAVVILSLAIWWANRQGAEQVDKPEPPKEQKQPTAVKKQAEKETPAESFPVIGKVFRDPLKSGGEGPEMVIVPAGSFQMGDVQGGGAKDELPVRNVKIQKPFAVGRYEVTLENTTSSQKQ